MIRRIPRRPVIAGFAAAALLLVGLRLTSLGFYRVTGQSMEPTALNGELLFVSNAPFAPSRGDVVIAGLAGEGQAVDAILKRVIGVPGDTVELRDGEVLLNGVELDEPYLAPGSITEPDRAGTQWRLGPDEYFLLGDNRAKSSDSRVFGTFPGSMILARPLFRYWPLDRIGQMN